MNRNLLLDYVTLMANIERQHAASWFDNQTQTQYHIGRAEAFEVVETYLALEMGIASDRNRLGLNARPC